MYVTLRIYDGCACTVMNIETWNSASYSKKGHFADLFPYNTLAGSIVSVDNKLKPGQRSRRSATCLLMSVRGPVGVYVSSFGNVFLFPPKHVSETALNQALAIPDS